MGLVGPRGVREHWVVGQHDRPSPEQWREALEAFRFHARQSVNPDDLGARSPAFIEALLPAAGALYDGIFRCETEVVSPLEEGPMLVVGNHNGITGMPDMYCHMVAFWRMRGAETKAFGLMHDVPFRVPLAGAWLNALGALRARPSNARAALAAGAALLVFPGGDLEASRPFRERYTVDFFGRRGFARLALTMGVPIVPLVSVGGHESLWIGARGSPIARALRLDVLFRSNVFPLGFALPLGPLLGVPSMHVPLPVKIHTRIGRPMTFGRSENPSSSEIQHVYDAVLVEMRTTMAELSRLGRHGLFPSDPRPVPFTP